MGERFEFICTHCGYNVEVSGGDDAGMIVATTTIVCWDCRRLYDVVIAELVEGGNFKERALRCPKSARHKFDRWKIGDPCPKCGNKFERGPRECLWD